MGCQPILGQAPSNNPKKPL